MISAKEAREISKKNKEILTEVAIVEVLPEIEELIKKNIDLGNDGMDWEAKEHSKYVYAIRDTLKEYGYTVTAKYTQTNGHYLSIYW